MRFLSYNVYIICGECFMSIGNNLYNARKKCGMTQEEVAKKLNISRQTLSKWESGDSTPDIGVFKELAVYYDNG